MLFLTYVKGDLVRTWVLAASRWLGQEVSLYHVDQYDPYLWTSIEGAFRRQFADTLEMERAQNKLRQGIRMKEGKICSVCHARFPEEGDDVWRPGLRGCGRRSLREVRNEEETSTGDN
jgi:hypothetical protein